MIEKNEMAFNQIKTISSKYLTDFDLRIIEIEEQNKVLLEKYGNWTELLVEPQSLNLARVQALEARLSDEENNRLAEFERLKSYMLKTLHVIKEVQNPSVVSTLPNISSRTPKASRIYGNHSLLNSNNLPLDP
jgi:hypothetical protein